MVGNLLQAKQISQERFDAMMACKKKIDDEVAAVKKEAMDFKADFGPQFTSGDQVFPMVQQVCRPHQYLRLVGLLKSQ